MLHVACFESVEVEVEFKSQEERGKSFVRFELEHDWAMGPTTDKPALVCTNYKLRLDAGTFQLYSMCL
jgi:hypothetical protein